MNNYCKELDEVVYCPQCGSVNITGVYHVNVNTKEVLDLFGMYENHWCDDCESSIGSGMTLRQLWQAFSEVPVDNNDEIEEDFLGFECGTDRFEVLRWFDERCPNGVKKDLMGGENEQESKTIKVKDADCERMILVLQDPKGKTPAISVKGYLYEEDHFTDPQSAEGLHRYSIRHKDDDMGEPRTIENSVIVNWFGWFFTETDLNLDGKEYLRIVDWNWGDELNH